MAPPEGRPGKVSAERSWPPGCGRLPAAPDDGDSGKGVAEGRAEEAAGVSSAACNGGLPHGPHQPERDEGGGAQPPGDGDARPSDGQSEGRVLDVMPLAFAAPQSSAVDSANGFMEDGDSLIVEGEGGHVSGQLAMDEDDAGNGDGRAVGSRTGDGELQNEEDVRRKKRWLTSAVNPPPKRRAVSARRRFPPGCGRAVVTGIGIDFEGLGPYPMSGRNDSNNEIEGKREEVGGAMEALNCKIQECQVVDRVALDDFAGSQHDRDRPRNNLTDDSPRHGFSEKMDASTPLGVPLVVGDGDVRSECEGSLLEGTSRTLLRGHVIVKTYGKRKLSHDNIDKDFKIQECQVVDHVVLDDFVGGQHDCDRLTNDSPRHGSSGKMDARTPLGVPLAAGDDVVRSECEGSLLEGTLRTLLRGHVSVKTYGWRKLKHDNTDKDTRNRSVKASKCEDHVAANQIEEKDDVGLTTKRVIVQALMAPDQCPWIQQKKSIASVSKSLTPRNKVKKNDATPRPEFPIASASKSLAPRNKMKKKDATPRQEFPIPSASKSLTPRNKVKKKDATPRQEFPSKVTPSTSTRYETRVDQKHFSLEDDKTSLAPDVHERSNEFCVTLAPCAASGDESVGTQSKVTKMDETGPLDQLEHAPLVTVDLKYEGGSQKGNPMTHVRGLVNVKKKGKKQEIVKVNVAWLDETGVLEDGTTADNISSTHRRVTRSNMKVKQCMVARKLKHDGINKDPLDRSTKESECGNHLSTDQTKENDGKVLVSNSVVLALMAPDRYPDPWTQRKRSIASASQPLNRGNKYLTVREGLCLPDISEGKESMPICVYNTIDDMQPMPFKYITKVMYPPSYEKAPPKGCDCTNGCSDSSECACAVKNEGEIPFNLNSAIVYTKPVIYECGPSCRCPPTCHNRVSQHGPQIRLEIFKTGKTGWGVRSPNFISSGSFICEYVGEVLQETDAERTENDEYLFDIGRDSDDDEEGLQSSTSEITNKDVGYTIDAAKCGNVGRFINHSCSPNLHAQDVLWDHDDTRVPHVMLFAEKNIPPLQELTYDYNYSIGQVLQNGKEKIKDCFCGSSKCRLRLY